MLESPIATTPESPHGSPSENPRGVDMRFDSRSGGSAAQMFLSVLNAVTLTNKHPNGAIQHRQFGETGEPGLAIERGKIGVELDHLSLTVNTCPSLIHPIHGRRCLVNGNAPRGRSSSRRRDR